jgi:AmmeMemoRadiSam system protein B
MKLRKRRLPEGWYPRDPRKIAELLEPFPGSGAPAAVSPHAGWYYSGPAAAMSVCALDRDAETVVIIGGHLPAGSPFLFAEEEGVETPLGVMETDRELSGLLEKELSGKNDCYRDNTVEVLVPMVHCRFPNARLVWTRFPAERSSFEAGKTLARIAAALGRRTAVLGSTDLTHYGWSYGFAPAGFGEEALNWVKNVNDRGFIRAVLSGDPREVLERAETDCSACSAGAVLGAMGFVQYEGKQKAALLDYRTSADVSGGFAIPDSFVGYAAIALTRQRRARPCGPDGQRGGIAVEIT